MPEQQSTLSTFYQGWNDYQNLLIKAIASLSPDQLALRAAPGLRSIGENRDAYDWRTCSVVS